MRELVKILPAELVSSVFSSFSTQPLLLSSSISKEWRNLIEADPTLRTILDLTGCKKTATPMQLMKAIQHLSSKARRPFREARLDLGPFWSR